MKDDERLREALLELGLLRAKETERLRETSTLLSALEAITTSPNVEESIRALQTSLQDALNCDAVALFESQNGYLEDQTGYRWHAPGLLTRARRIVDASRLVGLWDDPPEPYADMKALLSVPFGDGSHSVVLAAFSKESGKFSKADADLLERMVTVGRQAILRRSLESRNAFLAAVIDNSPVSVSISDAKSDLPLVYVNNAFTNLTGYSRQEILGQNCRFLAAEDPKNEVRSEIRKTVKEQTSGTFVLRNRKKDGEIFWNELQLFPICDAMGQTSHIVATQTDATQRMQAEMDRDAARRRLEGALAATAEAFMILGKDGHLRFANASFEAVLAPIELPQDEVLSAESVQFLMGDVPYQPAKNPTTVFSRTTNHELSIPDGRQFILRSRVMPDGGCVVAASDITQVKVNERALRQRLAAIERSQDGVAIGDADGRLIDLNPSLLSLWGLTSEEQVLGRKWTGFYDPASLEAFTAQEVWLQRTGVWRGEMEMTLDGKVFVHDVSLSLVPDVGSVLIVRDITERRRNTEERAQLQRRLDRAQMQERLHQVSAGLAHDFNNLLSAILGSASLIEASDGLAPSAQEAVNRIQLAAQRAAELTDGFLDLGDREKSPENVELGGVLRNTVDLARGSAPRGVRLTALLQDTPLIVEASQTDILQVVMNLVVNGIDAHDGMPGEVQVSVRRATPAEADGKFVVGTVKPDQIYAAIAVEDAGKGMSEDTLERVLEPYFTTKGNSGTGLGLAIVGSIVNDNDALLEVGTRLGRGTRFTVWWPISHSGPKARRRPSKIERVDLPILILDDVPDVAMAIASVLSESGYEVAETNAPEMAIETIEEDPNGWACLITDYDMPEMNGGDLIARLGQTVPDLPVIVVSALARRLTDRRLSNAIAVLQKPVNKDKLLAAVLEATSAESKGGV